MERKEIMDWVADEVSDEMEYVWNKHREDYDFTACQDYAPYGDTYVGTGYYTDEREEEQCMDDFTDRFDVNEFIDGLKTNVQFCEAIKELAKYVAVNN